MPLNPAATRLTIRLTPLATISPYSYMCIRTIHNTSNHMVNGIGCHVVIMVLIEKQRSTYYIFIALEFSQTYANSLQYCCSTNLGRDQELTFFLFFFFFTSCFFPLNSIVSSDVTAFLKDKDCSEV